MKKLGGIFPSIPFGGIELRHDRRVKQGNFVPDKKTGKYYRVHPGTVKRLDVAIQTQNTLDHPLLFDLRTAYMAKVLYPPIVFNPGITAVASKEL